VTHPVLLPSALEILDQEERIEKLVTTNTIPLPPEKHHPKIVTLSVANMLADIISRIHRGVSISEQIILA
jgi:ribose-phosphate pyrophosphokinase